MIKAHVPPELFELAKAYLSKRIAELPGLNDAVTQGRYEEILASTHKVKGTAAPYGLERLGELAHQLELAAKSQDSGLGHSILKQIDEYLKNVEITL